MVTNFARSSGECRHRPSVDERNLFMYPAGSGLALLFGKVLNEGARLTHEQKRFFLIAAAEIGLGGGHQRIGGAEPIPSGFEVGGQLRSHILLAAGKELQQLLRHAAMTARAPRGRLTLVEHLTIKPVSKNVERRLGAVREFVVSGGIEEMEPAG